jgi:hypothetical protein
MVNSLIKLLLLKFAKLLSVLKFSYLFLFVRKLHDLIRCFIIYTCKLPLYTEDYLTLLIAILCLLLAKINFMTVNYQF